jgi:hypothetical protein
MTIFATSSADTGEILAPEILDTAVLDLGNGTRRMPPYLAVYPISPIPRGHTDQHAAIVIPETIGIYPPPAAPPGRHALTERVGLHPVVRPTPRPHVVARQRADRRDRRARLASVLVLAVLAATVVLLAVAS